MFILCSLNLELLHSTMTMHASIFLILLVAVVVVQSNPHVAPQVIYQKLEDALIADSSVLYLMQEAFFPSQSLSQDLIYLNVCVTVGGVQPGRCNNSSLFSGQSNFSYCQYFQWSSSALLNFISFDQLLILDTVTSESIIHMIMHREYLHVPLHIDTVPCETTEDDILAALMQLLPRVYVTCAYVQIPCLSACCSIMLWHVVACCSML